MSRAALSRIAPSMCCLKARVGMALLAAWSAASWPPAASAAGTQAIDLQLLRTYVEIEYPKFSPDGKMIAYVAVHQDFAKDEYRDQVMLVDVASRTARSLGDSFEQLT